jgi:hypothetical protein
MILIPNNLLWASLILEIVAINLFALAIVWKGVMTGNWSLI